MSQRQVAGPVAAAGALAGPQLEVEVHSPLGLELYSAGRMMI